MKKALIFVSLIVSMFVFTACQTTTESLDLTLTGTIFIQLERVYDHFTELDLSDFTFYSALILMDETSNPPLYMEVMASIEIITAACTSILDNFTYDGLFPWGNSELVFEASVIFLKDNEQLVFQMIWGEMGTLMISHRVDGVELYGGTFPITSFSTQMATLLPLLSIESSV